MKRNKYIIPSLLSCALIFSCTQDFEEINKNPNGPITVPPGLLIPAVTENTMDLVYGIATGGDMGSCWAQHWAKVQYNDEERYKTRDTQFNTIWNSLYAGTIQDARIMEKLSETEGNKNLQGIAILMQVYAFSVLTDMFGDIPFTEALQAKEGINLPAYDLQEEIYPALLEMLDNANALFSEEGGSIPVASDILYAGDYAKWQRFANALKFRLLMRISSRSDFNRQSELEEIVTSRPIFTANTNEAKLIYLPTSPNNNPVNQTIIAGNRGEFKVNSVLVDMLTASSDPRLPVFAQRNNGGVYRGKPSGIINVPSAEWDYPNVSAIGTAYLSPTAPAFLMSYAEQEFLIAEAMQRGLISGGNAGASTHFDNGILSSMLSNGVSQANANQYLADHPYTASSAFAQIQTEKWIALFGQGIEAWTEWRRTKIPALTPAIEGEVSEIPSRYQYPPTELSLNGTNHSAAVAVQGGDLLTTKIWWMK